MDIKEMHNAFRTLGQQMGMQLIRGILPESIDVCINSTIAEKVQQELLIGVHTALQEGVATQASTMSSVNTFRTLYRNVRYNIDTDNIESISSKVNYYNEINGFHIINIPTIDSNITIDKQEYKINPMMFLGFSVEYDDTHRGSATACRLIGADVLETTLRDFCNGASKDSPIVVLNSIPIVKDGVEQTGVISNQQLEIYTGTKGLKVKHLNIKYIKIPNVVKFDVDETKCVHCDLPSYTHFDIVERAVAKFFAAIDSNATNKPTQVRQ